MEICLKSICLKYGWWTHFGTAKLKVTPCWCMLTNPNQCPYQVSTFYTFRKPKHGSVKIFKLTVTVIRSKVKSGSHNDVTHLHPLTNVPTKFSTSYTLQFPRYSLDKILWVKVTTARSKVKSRSHHVAHLHPLTNVPTKYHLPTPYGFRI